MRRFIGSVKRRNPRVQRLIRRPGRAVGIALLDIGQRLHADYSADAQAAMSSRGMFFGAIEQTRCARLGTHPARYVSFATDAAEARRQRRPSRASPTSTRGSGDAPGESLRHQVFELVPAVRQEGRIQEPLEEEVDQIICWLTGYSPEGLRRQIGSKTISRPSSPRRQSSIRMPRLSRVWCAAFGWRKSSTRSCRRFAIWTSSLTSSQRARPSGYYGDGRGLLYCNRAPQSNFRERHVTRGGSVPMLIAITREVSPSLAACELLVRSAPEPYVVRADSAAPRLSARAVDAGLRGARVLLVLPDHPDAVFVEDVAIVFDEIAVMTRPGAGSRRGEGATVADALKRHRELARSLCRRRSTAATCCGSDAMSLSVNPRAAMRQASCSCARSSPSTATR